MGTSQRKVKVASDKRVELVPRRCRVTDFYSGRAQFAIVRRNAPEHIVRCSYDGHRANEAKNNGEHVNRIKTLVNEGFLVCVSLRLSAGGHAVLLDASFIQQTASRSPRRGQEEERRAEAEELGAGGEERPPSRRPQKWREAFLCLPVVISLVCVYSLGTGPGGGQ